VYPTIDPEMPESVDEQLRIPEYSSGGYVRCKATCKTQLWDFGPGKPAQVGGAGRNSNLSATSGVVTVPGFNDVAHHGISVAKK
jgi:hypothetical protein